MIELKDLTKQFGSQTAVDHLNLEIKTGEFFGLLGPNGAGKTTTISMISTVLLPTEGEVLLDGHKLTRTSDSVRRQLSIVTQEYSMRQDMTVEQVMEYQGRLYYMPRKLIREKSKELLEFVGLYEHRKKTVRYLSGGMKRKLMVCRALMTDPKVLLLDEPTAGMDAFARRQMWDLLRRLNSGSMTIILTTHYMDEAETLCDRIALIHGGKLDRVDKPVELIRELGAFAVDEMTEKGIRSKFFPTREDAIGYLSGCGANASLRASTLEDVFIERTGRSLGRK